MTNRWLSMRRNLPLLIMAGGLCGSLAGITSCKTSNFSGSTPVVDNKNTQPTTDQQTTTPINQVPTIGSTTPPAGTNTVDWNANNSGHVGNLIQSILANLPSGGGDNTQPTYYSPPAGGYQPPPDINANQQVPTYLQPCTDPYRVPGTANPYLAGVPDGTSLTYDLSQGGGPNPTDVAPDDLPVLVAPIGNNCIAPGNTLYFWVTGMITFDKSVPETNADGFLNSVFEHQKGGILGKSNIVAPMSSLLGVFLADGDPSYNGPPQGFDFSTKSARDYTLLQPQIGQIFYIGTGKTSAGNFRQVVVPQGATRLYLAVMDSYQWNNNLGGVTGQILVQK